MSKASSVIASFTQQSRQSSTVSLGIGKYAASRSFLAIAPLL